MDSGRRKLNYTVLTFKKIDWTNWRIETGVILNPWVQEKPSYLNNQSMILSGRKAIIIFTDREKLNTSHDL